MHNQLLNYFGLEELSRVPGLKNHVQQLDLTTFVRDALQHCVKRNPRVTSYLSKNVHYLKTVLGYSDFEQRCLIGKKQLFLRPNRQAKLPLLGEVQVLFYQILFLSGNDGHGEVQVLLRYEFERQKIWVFPVLLLYDEDLTVKLELERLKVLAQRLCSLKAYVRITLVDLSLNIVALELALRGDLVRNDRVQHLILYRALDDVRPANRAPEVLRLLLKELNTVSAKRMAALQT